MVKNPPANAGDTGDANSILGSGRSPGGRHGNPLQCFCWKNLMGPGRLQSMGLQRVGHNWAAKRAHSPRPWIIFPFLWIIFSFLYHCFIVLGICLWPPWSFIPGYFIFLILLKYSWFTLLCSFLLTAKWLSVTHTHTHTYSFSHSLLLQSATGHWLQLSVLYSRSLLFIHPMYNSLPLLIPNPQSFPPLIPCQQVCFLYLWVCFCIIDMLTCIVF